MNKYYLMKIVEAAGKDGFKGRKRLQKVVFFLNYKGLDLRAEFGLHKFGPYSHDLSQACAELCAQNLLKETTTKTARGGVEYTYSLTETGRAAIAHTESVSSQTKSSFERSETLATKLINSDIWDLELGSTILFYYTKKNEWNDAFKNACLFKDKQVDIQSSKDAFKFTRSLVS